MAQSPNLLYGRQKLKQVTMFSDEPVRMKAVSKIVAITMLVFVTMALLLLLTLFLRSIVGPMVEKCLQIPVMNGLSCEGGRITVYAHNCGIKVLNLSEVSVNIDGTDLQGHPSVGTGQITEGGLGTLVDGYDCNDPAGSGPCAGQKTVTLVVGSSVQHRTVSCEGGEPIAGEGCASHASVGLCTSDRLLACEWCTACGESNKFSGGLDRCLGEGACAYSCKAGQCGAQCDSTCSDSCMTNMLIVGCRCQLADCRCTTGTPFVCDSSQHTNCQRVGCRDVGETASDFRCTFDGTDWAWRKDVPAESMRDGTCSDGVDNDCDGEADWDLGADGLHGDMGCPVGVTAVQVSDARPCPGARLAVTCNSSVPAVDSIKASIGSEPCAFIEWDASGAVFSCNAGAAGRKAATCSVDRAKSYQEGEDKSVDVEVTGSASCCSAYTAPSECGADSSCEWCADCSGPLYSGGQSACVEAGRCSHYCDAGKCGAVCDGTDAPCADSCTAGTLTTGRSCSPSCACGAGTPYDCATSSHTNCQTKSCGGANYRCTFDGAWAWRTAPPAETSSAPATCSDGVDNDCDGEADWAGAGGLRGDGGCPVEVAAIAVSSAAPCANEVVWVNCTSSVAEAASVIAYVGEDGCRLDYWDRNIAVFECGSGDVGSKEAKCGIDTQMSYQRGENKTAQLSVTIGPSCCGRYSQLACASYADICEWCLGCYGPAYTGGSDRCVAKGACPAPYCDAGKCPGAVCDGSDTPCIETCTADTLTIGNPQPLACTSSCSCSTSASYICTSSSHTNCEAHTCRGTAYKCTYDNSGGWAWRSTMPKEENGYGITCTDGVDNDCDGKIDDKDIGCCKETWPGTLVQQCAYPSGCNYADESLFERKCCTSDGECSAPYTKCEIDCGRCCTQTDTFVCYGPPKCPLYNGEDGAYYWRSHTPPICLTSCYKRDPDRGFCMYGSTIPTTPACT